MENAILVGLSRQVALVRELGIIANNMANVSTNGFKARSIRFEEFLSPKARAETFQGADQRLSYVIDKGAPLDLTPGSIEQTGNPLDAAIKGEGFFVVRTPAGERYTRNGNFQINQRGELVTGDGHVVQGESGPITVSPTETGLQFSPEGTLSSTEGQRGKLRIVRFADPQVLRNEGANLFSAPAPGQPVGPQARIEVGAIERSNVQPVIEMTKMIEVQRSYTSIATMLQRADELRRTAIQRLADVPA